MRFARVRDVNGKDIHVWIDDDFDPDAARLLVNFLRDVIALKGREDLAWEFSDKNYTESKTGSPK